MRLSGGEKQRLSIAREILKKSIAKNNSFLAFLLFQTEGKPFPFKENEVDDVSNEDEGEVIEGELDTDTSEETEEVKE